MVTSRLDGSALDWDHVAESKEQQGAKDLQVSLVFFSMPSAAASILMSHTSLFCLRF